MADALQQAGLSVHCTLLHLSGEAYSVIDGVTVDGVYNLVQAGVVEGERPEGLCWQRKREGDGIVIACGGI